MDTNNTIFALDIGTRTVVGVFGCLEDNCFTILDWEIMEQKSRAMKDGQVHNIDDVAKTVLQVKERLEERLGIKLENVAIAAAGRVLKTKNIHIEKLSDPKLEVTRENIEELELEGIKQGQQELDKEQLMGEEAEIYYCVGYSVKECYVNGYVISELLGQKGRSIGMDILATFLPNTVIDSLYSVTSRAGLMVTNLTLEPIAAINVAIPKELRMLNLAMVDIGAGTSDIALTKNGTVVAYSMVPVAGDEITEEICHSCLVDFATGEKIKLAYGTGKKEIKYKDIMGMKQVKKPEDIRSIIQTPMNTLADGISNAILQFNGKCPNAVFLVGGGSRIQGLTDMIADRLDIPRERVAVKRREDVQGIKLKFNGKALTGPEAVTPLGIGITALRNKDRDFMYVMVNDKRIKLYSSQAITAGDAIAMAGIKPQELLGRRGDSISFKLNNESRFVQGEPGIPGTIIINGEKSSLMTPIRAKDLITIIPGGRGEEGKVSIEDIREYYSGKIVEIRVNGQQVGDGYIVKNGDNVVVREVVIEAEKTQEKEINRAIEPPKMKIIVNGRQLEMEESIQGNIFVDIFKYVDIDPSAIAVDGKIELTLNGRPVAYTDPIKEGDVIEIQPGRRPAGGQGQFSIN